MDAGGNDPATESGHEIVISRVFDAPRTLVWKAWTEPQHVMQWWGPLGFSNAACEMDLRVGGAFNLVMCAPDGIAYPCRGVFHKIVEPECLVYESVADESHPCGAGLPPRSVVTVSLVEQGDGTLLTLHTRFENVVRKDAANRAGYSSSWGQALDRLASFLH